jgi:hypothetical protein
MSFKKHIPFLSAFFLMILLAACGTDKPSEKEQYEEMRASFKYKTYKVLSKGSVTFIADNYNKLDSANWKVQDSYFRLMLGYYWAISAHPAFAFAEADILSENSGDKNLGYLAAMLNSCTMYQQGWTTLAKEESDKGISLASTDGDKEMVEMETMIFHLLVGTVCVQQENYDAAKFHFAGFGQLTGVDFPYKLIDIMVDIKKGDVQSGLKKAKILADDPMVPEAVRVELKSIVAEAETKGGDVNSSMFWPKVISSFIIDEMKRSSKKGVSGLMDVMSTAADKLN